MLTRRSQVPRAIILTRRPRVHTISRRGKPAPAVPAVGYDGLHLRATAPGRQPRAVRMGHALNVETLEPRRLLISPELDLTFGRGGLATLRDNSEFSIVRELADGR